MPRPTITRLCAPCGPGAKDYIYVDLNHAAIADWDDETLRCYIRSSAVCPDGSSAHLQFEKCTFLETPLPRLEGHVLDQSTGRTYRGHCFYGAGGLVDLVCNACNHAQCEALSDGSPYNVAFVRLFQTHTWTIDQMKDAAQRWREDKEKLNADGAVPAPTAPRITRICIPYGFSYGNQYVYIDVNLDTISAWSDDQLCQYIRDAARYPDGTSANRMVRDLAFCGTPFPVLAFYALDQRSGECDFVSRDYPDRSRLVHVVRSACLGAMHHATSDGSPYNLAFVQLFKDKLCNPDHKEHAALCWVKDKYKLKAPTVPVAPPKERLVLPDGGDLDDLEFLRLQMYYEKQRTVLYDRFVHVFKEKCKDPALNPTKAATTPCTSEMFYDLFFSKEGTTILNGDLGFAALREAGFECERIPAIMRPCSGSWVPAMDDDIADNYYFCVVKHNVWL